MLELSIKNNQKTETSSPLLFSVCHNILTDVDLVDIASSWKEISLFEKIFLCDEI